MKHSAEMIIGERPDLSFYGLLPGMLCDDIIAEIRKRIEAKPDTQFLLVADFSGGSMCNAAMSLLAFGNVKLVAGMNLMLVIELLEDGDEALGDEQIAEKIELAKKGTKQITPESIASAAAGDDEFF